MLTQAVGIAVTPSAIEFQTNTNQEKTTILIVTNSSADVSLFEAYVDTFEDLISVRPASFILESGEPKKITLTVNASQEQIITTDISIVSRPVTDNVFRAQGGVKIPLKVTIGGGQQQNMFSAAISDAFRGMGYSILIIASVFIVLGFIFGRFTRRTRNSE